MVSQLTQKSQSGTRVPDTNSCFTSYLCLVSPASRPWLSKPLVLKARVGLDRMVVHTQVIRGKVVAGHSHGIIKDRWTKTVTRPAWESQGIFTEEGTRADPQRMSLIFPMEETIGRGFQELKGILIRGNCTKGIWHLDCFGSHHLYSLRNTHVWSVMHRTDYEPLCHWGGKTERRKSWKVTVI